MRILSHLTLVITLAWRQLVGHRKQNLFTGSLLAVSAAFVVTAISIVGTVQHRIFSMMSRTMMGSFQVYSAKAPEELFVGGAALGAGSADISFIDFPKVRELLKSDPNVQYVLPMGTLLADCVLPNPIEEVVVELREAVLAKDQTRVDDAIRLIKARIRAHTSELDHLRKMLGEADSDAEAREQLAYHLSDEFWAKFPQDPEAGVLSLEEHIVPLAGDTDRYAMPLLGADMDLAQESFSSWKIVKGEWVPKGHRGLLLNRLLWDIYYEFSVSRELKSLFKDVVVEKKQLPPNVFQNRVATLVSAYDDLVLQLDNEQAAWLSEQLRTFLKVQDGTVTDLLKQFLSVTPENLVERHKFFYGTIAAKVRTHRIQPGDTVVMRAWGRFPTSASVKVYGVIEFPEFKDTIVANPYNRIDLVTYRILDGEHTDEVQAEFDALRGTVKPHDVTFEAVESLFNDADSTFVAGTTLIGGRTVDYDILKRKAAAETITQDEIEKDRVEQAAVFLRNENSTAATRRWVERVSAEAGIPLKTGGPDQTQPFVTYNMEFFQGMTVLSAVAVFVVIMLVSLLAISILVIGRMRELGILRAIGAAPSLAARSLLFEMAMLGFVAGSFGAAIGTSAISYWSVKGIPAANPALALLFAGPRLFPEVNTFAIVAGIVSAIAVALLAAIYPAKIAGKVQPAFAMR